MVVSKRVNLDSLPHLIQQASLRLRAFGDSVIGGVLLRWWGVRTGKHLQLIGMPKIRRAPRAQIQIGTGCKLISLFSANSHGVTRPCFLAATSPDSRIEIGDACGLSGTVITATEKIILGNRVQCGANTLISDNDAHSLDAATRRGEIEGRLPRGSRQAESRPVIIHDDVWLGMNVTVLKGVEIGPRSVIGAGSLVTRSIPADSLAVGVPARVIKSLRGSNE
jgi:acetyltransferase-like isoleucine patch superfamily enzyme